MDVNRETIKKSPILGCLPKAGFFNLALSIFALILGAILGGPKMAIESQTSLILFFILLGLYLGLTIWSTFSLKSKRAAGQLQTDGIYKFVRHPLYGAIIFLFNPALAILLHSWLLMVAGVFDYFIWRNAIKDEEKKLIEIFGDAYKKYQRAVWPFFPNLFKMNKPSFFALWTIAAFLIVFIGLNFSAFYLLAAQWSGPEPQNTIQLPARTRAGSLPTSQQSRVKYEKPNSIIIEKINIEAPLVFSSGTSQKELNQALDQGVVIYPGSVMPGQKGDLFLSGHSSSYPWDKTQYGQVFTLLNRLEPGDLIIIYYNQYQYTYQVTKKYVTTPDKAFIWSQTSSSTITLMTCWPIGTALKRLMVEGELID